MGKERLYREGLVIDDRNRVVIPSELLKELKINNGHRVCVYADFESKKIIIKRGADKK